MGIVLTDYVFESIIREGLAELRARPEIVDDLMGQLLTDYLKTDYGQKVVNDIKQYIKDNKVYVYQSYGLQGNKMPCYSINLNNALESDREAGLQDYAGDTVRIIDAEVIVDEFTPDSYDSVSRIVYVDDVVDLSAVRPGNVFFDTGNSQFLIVGGIDDTDGSKRFMINLGASNSAPNISGDCKIKSQVTSEIVEIESIPIREQVLIGVYAQNDPNLAKFFYYLLMYFLHRRKPDLEARGVELSSISASDFSRDDLSAEHIYARYVTASCLTRFSYQGDTQNVFADIGIGVLVPVDKVETIDPLRTVNTETLPTED